MPRAAEAKIDVQAALRSLQGWAAPPGRDAMARSYRFKDFSTAFGFMTRVALAAERLDHHPEWTNVYNRVDVVLVTHSAGGVTALDVEFARIIDEAAVACGAQR
jgi:4a-hydroxytetrahydrobiopterin dehydratase